MLGHEPTMPFMPVQMVDMEEVPNEVSIEENGECVLEVVHTVNIIKDCLRNKAADNIKQTQV